MPLGLALKQLVPQRVEPPLERPFDVYYNSTAGTVWVADYNLSTTIPVYGATIYDVTSPTVNLNNQFGSFNGPRRIVGDADNVYVSNGPRFGGAPVTNANQVAIISQTSGNIVGLCQTANLTFNSMSLPTYALDQTVDGGDGLYVIATETTYNTSVVQKFSISAALAAYPAPVSPTVATPTQTYDAIAYDPSTNQVFVAGTSFTSTLGGPQVISSWTITGVSPGSPGSFTTSQPIDFYNGSRILINLTGGPNDYSISGPGGGPYLYEDYATITGTNSFSFPGSTVSGSGPIGSYFAEANGSLYYIAALDPTTLDVNASQNYTDNASVVSYAPVNMTAGFGSLWISMYTTQLDSTGGSFGSNNGIVVKVDPSTFPASGSTLGTGPLIGSSNVITVLNADTIGNTIICGEGLLGESVQYIYRINESTGAIASTITINGYEVVCNAAVNTPGGIWIMANGNGIYVYSNTIGSETETHNILTY